MTLRKFIKLFVCSNSLIRLWCFNRDCELMRISYLEESEDSFKGKDTFTDWEILDGLVKHSEFLNDRVVGVGNVPVEDGEPNAVNIIIMAKGRDKNEV